MSPSKKRSMLTPFGVGKLLPAPPLPQSIPSSGDAQGSRTAEVYLACSRCRFPISAVPTTCPLCHLLITCPPLLHTAFAEYHALAPPCEALEPSENPADQTAKCSACHNTVARHLMRACTGCRTQRCESCCAFVTNVLRVCTGCVRAYIAPPF